MMVQYLALKAKVEDCLLFYRMGDFFELFFDDARAAAATLDIALTSRGEHDGRPIPMCGVPVHAADMYLQKLIASGVRVAICEQMETPEEAKKRGGHKAVVRREVVRVVTPGTITEESLMAPTQSHYLACLALHGQQAALAWLELATGEFTTMAMAFTDLPAQLARLQPRELVISQAAQDQLNREAWFYEWRTLCTARPDTLFDARSAARRLHDHYKVADLSGFGHFSAEETVACGVLLDYLGATQLEAAARLDVPKHESTASYMQMDAATRRNLELVLTLNGTRRGSLLATIDRTVTACGGRLLGQWVAAPLYEMHGITARADAVEYVLEHTSLRHDIRAALKVIADMERAIGRLSLGRGGPRDLLQLGQGLQQANLLHERLRLLEMPALLAGVRQALQGHHVLADLLAQALKPEVPMQARDGHFVAEGYRADLDEWRRLRDESKRVIAAMEAKLKQETAIPSLKIKQNNVLGYFIEVTQIHEKKVPPHFIHRQGLVGSLRYSTPELNDIARNITEAGEKALQLELMVFEELRSKILQQGEAIIAAARALAQLDVITALAQLAEEGAWVRPQLTSQPMLTIRAGRHPVVEAAVRRQHLEFIANDCLLAASESPTGPSQDNPGMLHLITGPNMGGKSTFLRQQAVLVILAQLGSFIPAQSAVIGLVDKLFCRVGAADDLARGQSTFMVEMVETASILHQATAQSLVVLDEIGRGTATYDGVSIAWAVAEHLHDSTKCRALFATHYHELTALAETLPRLKNYHASAKEFQGTLVFLHTITPGYADKSYGIHVAALAGMPQPVLVRARHLLQTLESGHRLNESASPPELPLFQYTEKVTHPLAERLAKADVDDLTPRQALDLVAELKRLAAE